MDQLIGKNKVKINYGLFGLCLVFFMLLTNGCSPTRHVPEGDYLLRNNKVILEEETEHEMSKRALTPLVRQRPNKKIVGLRFHLWLYNLSGDEERKINQWLRDMGEKPVVYDPLMVERARQSMSNYLINRGYRNAYVQDSVITGNQRATVEYHVYPGTPYYINRLVYNIEDSSIASILLPDTVHSLLQSGMLFDMEVMEEERKRLVSLLKNQGYFLFNRDHVYYEADTTEASHQANLTLGIRLFQQEEDGDLLSRNHPVFKVDQIFAISGYEPNRFLVERQAFFRDFDTLYKHGLHHVYKNQMSVKPRTIRKALKIEEESLYSQYITDKSYRNLVNLKAFRLVNIKYIQPRLDPQNDTGYLDCHVLLNTAIPQSYSLDIEGTNYQGNLGFASNFIYNHKNLFRGAESFGIKLRGAVEALQETEETGIDNTIELGGDVSLSTPKLILPLRMERFVTKYDPRTSFVLGYNYQQRPDYTRTISNARIGYDWQRDKVVHFFLNPMEFDLVRLPESYQTDRFREEIQGTYLSNSFNDHLIVSSRFFFTVNRPARSQENNRIYLRYSLETGGNFLNLWHDVSQTQIMDNSYRIFGVEYTQYMKSDVDFRKYFSLNNTDQLAARLFLGVAVPYGNSEALPFEKKYFAGGANSLRAWQVRTLGPGSSRSDTLTRFPNSFGDMRIEANLEYRFQLFWLLEGALFADVGNIWSLTETDDQEAQFRFEDFYKELALSVGAGIRFDFSFFVLRFDYALKTRDPVLPEGQRSVWQSKGLRAEDGNLIFSIGYPF